MNRFRKNTDGFTLVEIIVTLMILSIVIILSGSMFFSSSNMFQHTEKSNRAKLFGDEVFKLVTDDLKFATNIQIIEDDGRGSVADGGYKYQNVYRFNLGDEKNKVFKSTDFGKSGTYNNIYGDGMYGDMQLRITVTPQYKERRQGVLSFTVDVLNKDGDVSYTTGSDILVNTMYTRGSTFEYMEDSVKGDGDTYVNPVISYVQKSMDPLEMTAKEVRKYYIGTYNELVKVKKNFGAINKETIKNSNCPNWYEYNENVSYLNNDAIRNYVCGEYFQNIWPEFEGFPDQMLSSIPQKNKDAIDKFCEKNKLFYQPMIGGSLAWDEAFSEENCFVYLGANSTAHGSGGQWRAYFVFDHENSMWYASALIETTGTSSGQMGGQGIAQKNWVTLKQELTNTTQWIPLKPYPTN